MVLSSAGSIPSNMGQPAGSGAPQGKQTAADVVRKGSLKEARDALSTKTPVPHAGVNSKLSSGYTKLTFTGSSKLPSSTNTIMNFVCEVYTFFLLGFLTAEQRAKWPSLSAYTSGCEQLGPGEILPFCKQRSAVQSTDKDSKPTVLQFSISVSISIADAIKELIVDLAMKGKGLIIPEIGICGPLTVSGKHIPRIFTAYLENVPPPVSTEELIDYVEKARDACTVDGKITDKGWQFRVLSAKRVREPIVQGTTGYTIPTDVCSAMLMLTSGSYLPSSFPLTDLPGFKDVRIVTVVPEMGPTVHAPDPEQVVQQGTPVMAAVVPPAQQTSPAVEPVAGKEDARQHAGQQGGVSDTQSGTAPPSATPHEPPPSSDAHVDAQVTTSSTVAAAAIMVAAGSIADASAAGAGTTAAQDTSMGDSALAAAAAAGSAASSVAAPGSKPLAASQVATERVPDSAATDASASSAASDATPPAGPVEDATEGLRTSAGAATSSFAGVLKGSASAPTGSAKEAPAPVPPPPAAGQASSLASTDKMGDSAAPASESGKDSGNSNRSAPVTRAKMAKQAAAAATAAKAAGGAGSPSRPAKASQPPSPDQAQKRLPRTDQPGEDGFMLPGRGRVQRLPKAAPLKEGEGKGDAGRGPGSPPAAKPGMRPAGQLLGKGRERPPQMGSMTAQKGKRPHTQQGGGSDSRATSPASRQPSPQGPQRQQGQSGGSTYGRQRSPTGSPSPRSGALPPTGGELPGPAFDDASSLSSDHNMSDGSIPGGEDLEMLHMQDL